MRFNKGLILTEQKKTGTRSRYFLLCPRNIPICPSLITILQYFMRARDNTKKPETHLRQRYARTPVIPPLMKTWEIFTQRWRAKRMEKLSSLIRAMPRRRPSCR